VPTHHPHNAPRPSGDNPPKGRARNGIRWPLVVVGIALLLVVVVVLIAVGFVG
jgi:hypothetical protein